MYNILMSTTTDSCVHHWICDSGPGLETHAVCKRCGKETTFCNWVPLHPLPGLRRDKKRNSRRGKRSVENPL